jgi:HTH-type transcriptional regulator/antitoxin HipB
MLIRTLADLAALIKERRTRLGLDQADLAKQAGVSRKWIIDVERGKSGAEIGLILRTLRVLGVSLEVNEASPKSPEKKTTTAPAIADVNAIVDALKKKP